jgi:prenylcysteine oxidase/farnesylcysteine lyase
MFEMTWLFAAVAVQLQYMYITTRLASIMSSLLLFAWLLATPAEAKKVAIIGGGVSGTFAAKYLADYDNNCTLESITIFDPMPIGEATTVDQEGDVDWQGSRVASLQLKDGTVVELGASVAINDFRLLVQMLEGDPTLKMGEAHTTGKEDNDRNDGIGIYDGDGTWSLLTSNTPSILSKLKMLLRYNVDLWTMSRAAKTLQIGLARIHAWLDSDYPTTFFESPDEMWNASGMLRPAHMSFDAFLDAIGLPQELPWWRSYLPFQGSLRAELLTATNLCNYNQANSQVNGTNAREEFGSIRCSLVCSLSKSRFTGLVGVGSFISAKVELFSIIGGNRQVIKSALTQAQTIHTDRCETKAIQHVQKRVTSVIGDLEGMEVFSDAKSLGQFDVVILAAPIQQSRIAFLIRSDKDSAVLHDMPLFADILDMEEKEVEDLHKISPSELPNSVTRPYTQVVTTVLSNATLQADHFHLLDAADLPRGIYMTENGNAKEYGITAIGQITSGGVYKIFSSEQLNETTLGMLFEPGYEIEYVKVWGGPYGGATPDYRGQGKTVQYLLYDSSAGADGYVGGALYYPNAIEASFACMELSAIGAKSVARLIAKRFGLIVPQEIQNQSDEL